MTKKVPIICTVRFVYSSFATNNFCPLSRNKKKIFLFECFVPSRRGPCPFPRMLRRWSPSSSWCSSSCRPPEVWKQHVQVFLLYINSLTSTVVSTVNSVSSIPPMSFTILFSSFLGDESKIQKFESVLYIYFLKKYCRLNLVTWPSPLASNTLNILLRFSSGVPLLITYITIISSEKEIRPSWKDGKNTIDFARMQCGKTNAITGET